MKLLETIKYRWVVWVWNHTPNCAEMSRLTSQSLEQPLPLKLRLRMRLHHLICVWCARYQKHLGLIRNAAGQSPEEFAKVSEVKLSPEAKKRLIRALCDHPNG